MFLEGGAALRNLRRRHERMGVGGRVDDQSVFSSPRARLARAARRPAAVGHGPPSLGSAKTTEETFAAGNGLIERGDARWTVYAFVRCDETASRRRHRGFVRLALPAAAAFWREVRVSKRGHQPEAASLELTFF